MVKRRLLYNRIFTFIWFIHKCTLKFVQLESYRNPAKSHGIAGYKNQELAELLLKKWDGF